MPKPVKKIKTTYEAFVWDGSNEGELDAWDMYDRGVSESVFGDELYVTYYEPETGDYNEVWFGVGDALIKPSRGKIKHLRKYEYEEKFEDA